MVNFLHENTRWLSSAPKTITEAQYKTNCEVVSSWTWTYSKFGFANLLLKIPKKNLRILRFWSTRLRPNKVDTRDKCQNCKITAMKYWNLVLFELNTKLNRNFTQFSRRLFLVHTKSEITRLLSNEQNLLKTKSWKQKSKDSRLAYSCFKNQIFLTCVRQASCEQLRKIVYPIAFTLTD